jgi:hypothetical protein
VAKLTETMTDLDSGESMTGVTLFNTELDAFTKVAKQMALYSQQGYHTSIKLPMLMVAEDCTVEWTIT